jgi:hypothetical protein
LRAVNPLRVLAAGAPTEAAAGATGAATEAAGVSKHGPGSGGGAGGRPLSRLMSARSGSDDFASVVADALDARSSAAAAQSSHGRQRRGSGAGQSALGVYFAPVRSRSGGHGRGVGGASGGGSSRGSRGDVRSGGGGSSAS